MPTQTGANFIVAIKTEGASFNTAPGATGATQLRLLDSPGLELAMAEIKSGERRSDLLDTMARMGSRQVTGSYNAEMIVGAHDVLFEAVMRATWVAAVAITVDGGAALTSFEVLSTSTFQFAGTTTPIVAGLRVGDVFRFTNMSNAANNSINVRVKSIAASVVTVHGTPLTVQAADSAATITILKKLSHPTTPVRRSFYVDQYFGDIDQSQVFGGVRFLGMKISGGPDAMAMVEFSAMGASMTPLATGGSSPYFTTPALPTGSPLVFADATISLGGVDIATLAAFELNYGITADTLKLIGATVTPDIYDNKATLSGSISGARSDLTRLTAYSAETEYELHVHLVEPEAEPKDCIDIYVPRIKLTGVTAQLGGDGAMIEQMNWTSGVKEGASALGFNTTMMTILTSAA